MRKMRYYYKDNINMDNNLTGFIGVFWYIDDKDVFKYIKYELAEEILKTDNAGSNYITPLVSHPLLWDNIKKEIVSNERFDYYPRGRVNYNIKRNLYEIDMDDCLNTDEYAGKIRELFVLDKQNAVIVPNNSKNGHYSCHLCWTESQERE